METGRPRIGEGGDNQPDDLLELQSTTDTIEHKPDPYVLKQTVAALKSFQQRASRRRIPDDIVNLVVQGIVTGFRRLDALPREHPFWEQSNRRPTLGKLSAFSAYVLRDEPRDLSALRTAVAYQILTYQNFDPGFW